MGAEIVVFVATMLVCEERSCSTLTIQRPSVYACLDAVDDELARMHTIAIQDGLYLEIEVFPWCAPVMISTSGMVEAE